MAKKKKRNPFAAINRARKAARGKKKVSRRRQWPGTSMTTKRRKAPKKAKRRSTMARKKSGTKRRSPRRSGGSNKAMNVAQSIMLGVGGAVVGGIASRALQNTLPNPTMRGGALAAVAAFGAAMLPASMLPIAIGFGIRGGMTVAQNLLPGITGLGEEQQLAQLSPAEVDELQMALLENGVGADEHYQENLVGYDDKNAALVGEDGEEEDGVNDGQFP